MYYAWDNCDVLNQFIEKKMNLLTNFPIFKNLFDKLLITLPNKELIRTKNSQFFFLYYIVKKNRRQKSAHDHKNHNTKNIFLFRLTLSWN